MKYFINFLKNVEFNSVHNVMHKTFADFGCPYIYIYIYIGRVFS